MDERGDGYAHAEERPGTMPSSVTIGYLLGHETKSDAAGPILLRAKNVKRPTLLAGE
jgi:hypothetical protein